MLPASIVCGPLLRHAAPCLSEVARRMGKETVLDFSPLPLPALRGIEMHRIGTPHEPTSWWSSQDTGAHRQLSCASALSVSAFGLSLLPFAAFSPMLDALHAAANHAVFLDFKEAERNIELPSSLLFGRLRRFCGRSDSAFHAFGGLEGLLYQESARFQVLERQTLLGGGLLCVLVECLH